MKKFNLFLILVIILTGFLGGYIAIKRGVFDGTGSTTGTLLDKFDGQKDAGIESVEETKPALLNDRRVSFPANSSDKKGILYYDKATGKIFELNLGDGAEQLISDRPAPGLVSLKWSPNKKTVLSTSLVDGKPQFKYLNLETGKEVALGPNVHSVAFSPDGSLVAYYYFNEAASPSQPGKIVISEPEGFYQKKILDTRLRDLELGWPLVDGISLKTQVSELFLLSEDSKLQKLFDQEADLEVSWSPSGKKVIFSVLSDKQPEPRSMLWLKDIGTKNETSLDLPGKASKCVWSIDDTNVFCAIPKSPSTDDIYLINTADNYKKIIAEPYTSIKEILLSGVEDQLIYLDASDDKLYKIKIID